MLQESLDRVFAALADPTRRAILSRLAAGEATVNELVAPFALSQPTISKHLQVLRDVGLVTVRREGRRTMYRTNAETLRTVHDWSGMFAQYWRGQLRPIKTHAEGKR